MEFNGKRSQLSTHQNRIINNQLKTLTIIISHHTNKKKTIHVTQENYDKELEVFGVTIDSLTPRLFKRKRNSREVKGTDGRMR